MKFELLLIILIILLLIFGLLNKPFHIVHCKICKTWLSTMFFVYIKAKYVDMAPRSTGRSSIPDKPVSDKTMAFEHHDGHQNHQEEQNKCMELK